MKSKWRNESRSRNVTLYLLSYSKKHSVGYTDNVVNLRKMGFVEVFTCSFTIGIMLKMRRFILTCLAGMRLLDNSCCNYKNEFEHDFSECLLGKNHVFGVKLNFCMIFFIVLLVKSCSNLKIKFQLAF